MTPILWVPASHAATVNSILAARQWFLSLHGLEGHRCKAVENTKALFCDERQELTRAEYALVSTAQKVGNGRLSLVMQTICATGIRVSELRFITVEAVTTGRAEALQQGQTPHGRYRAWLRRLLQIPSEAKTAGAVFTTRTGRPLDRSNIWRDMRKPSARARTITRQGIPHSICVIYSQGPTTLWKKTCPGLGHSGPFQRDTTRIYTVESGGVHQRQLRRMGLIIT